MHKSGVTSITFRDLSTDQIIDLCLKTKLQGIEWGSDVHIQKGELEKANGIKKICNEKSLEIYSYATYYKLMQGLDPKQEFTELLKIADALKSPIIRVWAARKASADVDESFYQQAAVEARALCDLAAPYGITVAFEYHRKSLTDTSASALKLIKLIHRENIKLYWQPNPELSLSDNLLELKEVRDQIVCVHTFSWDENNERYPLLAQQKEWLKYWEWIPLECPILLEFVQKDSVIQFEQDAQVLNYWCQSLGEFQ